jgi:hypothetical protein
MRARILREFKLDPKLFPSLVKLRGIRQEQIDRLTGLFNEINNPDQFLLRCFALYCEQKTAQDILDLFKSVYSKRARREIRNGFLLAEFVNSGKKPEDFVRQLISEGRGVEVGNVRQALYRKRKKAGAIRHFKRRSLRTAGK